MNSPDISLGARDYLKRVEELLIDIDEDDRQTLMAELGDQIGDLSSAELSSRLGTPDAFATEYRRSAGIDPRVEDADFKGTGSKFAILLSVLGLPIGVAVFFSFGGQLVFGPFVLGLEWILARISPRPLRIAWSVLAGALVGEIVFLLLDIYVPSIEGFSAFAVGLVFASAVAVLFYRTTARDD